jgi:hypothetical protein
MDLSVYKIMHYVAIMALFFGLGGLTLGALNASGKNFANRKIFSILHGVGLFFILFSGFGQMARLGLTTSMPHWVVAKIILWLILGASIALIFRKPALNKYFWVFLIVAGSLAAYLGHLKPI